MFMFSNIKDPLFFIYKNLSYFILIVIAIFSCHKYDLYHKKNQEKNSSYEYEQMLISYKKKDFISVMYHANNINEKYKNTVHDNISQLFLAKNAFMNCKYKKTNTYLKNIKYNKHNSILKNIVNERLIKTYIMRKKWKKALILLDFYDKKEINSTYLEIKGDIYLSLKEFDKAKTVYRKAKKIKVDKIRNYFLDIKIKYLNIINI